MKQRVITGIIMGIIFIPFFALGNIFSTLLVTVLAYVGTYELISMRKSKSNIPSICKYVIPLFTVMLVLAINYLTLEDIIYILVLQFVFIILLPIFNKGILFEDVKVFIFSIIYVGTSFGIIGYIRNYIFPSLSSYVPNILGYVYNPGGLVLLCYILTITIFTDIFAYLFGIKFGKHKLCPTISPKKSIEGAIAGTIFGSVFGTLLLYLNSSVFSATPTFYQVLQMDNTWLFLLITFIISLVLSIAGQLGDLVASKIKREYEIKDYGKIFPGHGGVLDRFDSAIYASLVFFVIFMMLEVF